MINWQRVAEHSSNRIDRLIERLGSAVSWLSLAMVLLIGWDVMMRYLFQSGSVALQELEWHLFSILFLLGAAYTLKHDGHVRVDILYKSRLLSDRSRAWVDMLGSLVFLIPFCLIIIINSATFVESSYTFAESSPDPGGLPYRWLLKAMIPAAFSLLLLQGISMACKNLARLLEPDEE